MKPNLPLKILALAFSLYHNGYALTDPLSVIFSFNAYAEGQPRSNLVTQDNGISFYAHSDWNLYKIDTASQTLTLIQKALEDDQDIGHYSFDGNLTLSHNKQSIYGLENSFKHGVVFKLNLTEQSPITYLHQFDLNNRFEEGYDAVGTPVVTQNEQKIFGATESGGLVHARSRGGVIYQITVGENENPTYKVIHAFTGTEDGYQPNGKLVLSHDERYLYGVTTHSAFPNYCGTLFRINLDDSENPVFETLRSLNCTTNQGRINTLLLSKDGNTVYASSGDGYGSVIKIDLNKPDYPITALHQFEKNNEGQHPTDLVLNQDETLLFGISTGSDSKYYHYHANIFKISLNTPHPNFSVLYTFATGSDYKIPSTPEKIILNEAEDSLFGISANGGEFNWGTLFKLNLVS